MGRSELNLIMKKWISIALLEDWILELLLGVKKRLLRNM